MKKAIFPILSILLLVGCGQNSKSSTSARKAVPVIAEKAKAEKINLYFETTGELHPAKTLALHPEVTEKISYIACKEGEFVNEGTLLFTLDKTACSIRLNESSLELSKAEANLKSQENKIIRYSQLKRRDSIAEIEWDDMEQARHLYEAEKKAAEIRVEKAKLEMSKTIVKAPFAGTLGRVYQSEHEIASPSKPIATLSDFSKYTVEFYLSEEEAKHLLESGNQKVLIAALDCNDAEFEAKLTFMDKTLHPQTKQVFAKAEIDAPSMPLFSGQHVRVKILSKTLEDRIAVAEKAVHSSSDGYYVYLVKDDLSVEKKNVRPLCYLQSKVVIDTGLSPGDLIVTEGHLKLFPGQLVEVTERELP